LVRRTRRFRATRTGPPPKHALSFVVTNEKLPLDDPARSCRGSRLRQRSCSSSLG
jgi:hypothetical protein